MLHERIEAVGGDLAVRERQPALRIDRLVLEAEEVAAPLVVAQPAPQRVVAPVGEPGFAIKEAVEPVPLRDRAARLCPAGPSADPVVSTVERSERLVPWGPAEAAQLAVPLIAAGAEQRVHHGTGVAPVAGGIGVGDHAQGFQRFGSRAESGGLGSGDAVLGVVGGAVELEVDERAARAVRRNRRRAPGERIDVEGIGRSDARHQVQQLVDGGAPFGADHDRQRLDLLAREAVLQGHLLKARARPRRRCGQPSHDDRREGDGDPWEDFERPAAPGLVAVAHKRQGVTARDQIGEFERAVGAGLAAQYLGAAQVDELGLDPG